MKINPINKNSIESIEVLNGIFRKTLVYNDTVMLCLFTLNKDAEIPLHNHEAHQIGYILKGEVKFFTENDEFIAKGGDSYVFGSHEKHGAKILEDAEIIEVFSPSRDDYK